MYTNWIIRSLSIKYSRLHFSILVINFRCKYGGMKWKSAFWFFPFLFQPSISHAAGNRQTNYVSDDIKWKIIRIFSLQRYMQHAAWSMQHLPSPNAFINGSGCQMLPDDADASHESGHFSIPSGWKAMKAASEWLALPTAHSLCQRQKLVGNGALSS